MLADVFNALLEWIRHNPHWAYLGVFLISAGESLALVGLFLPGVAIMFGIGALVAAGALELWPTLGAAAAGAVLGDGVSFWLGRHFHQHLRVMWPFSRYPALMNRGVDFFYKHGGKSVVLARFLGPVRPILPTVAGMLDMPPRRFFAVNVLSALLWAPAYTLPGVVFGASLGLASQVAGRLALLLLVLVALVWFTVWLVGLIFRYLQPRAGFLLARALDWGNAHPLLQPLTSALLDPTHPEARGLAALVVVLAAASLLTTWLLGGWLAGLDRFLLEVMGELRSPIADQVMVFITGLGDTALLLTVLAAGGSWLWLRGRRNAALHWFGLVAATALLTYLLKFVVAAQRPAPFYSGLSSYSFPSTHTTLSTAVYGFLAVLIARELTAPRRWAPYLGAALLVIPIAFSRLYLGAHWLSDVLGGLVLGLVALALFGIAYRRHPAQALGWQGLLWVCLLTVTGVGLWRDNGATAQTYDVPHPVRTFTAAQWRDRDWHALPAQRQDFHAVARQALNLQYAGELSVLQAALTAAGWRRPTELSPTSALQWLAPQPAAEALPILPQVHAGEHDVLRLQRRSPDGRLYLVRVWPSDWQLRGTATPVWVGSVGELVLHRQLRLFTYLTNRSASDQALEILRQDVGAAFESVQRRNGEHGEVLLLRAR